MAEDIKSELVKLNTMFEALLREQSKQTELLEDIDTVVRKGNGKPPLTERVRVLEENEKDQDSKISENATFIKKSLTTFGVAVTGLITALTSWLHSGS
jgi:hypothetical protein